MQVSGRKTGLWISMLLIVSVVVLLVTGGLRSDAPNLDTITVEEGPLTIWSVYEGKLAARNVKAVMSRFKGNATIVYLIPEGTEVQVGDVLVQFDSSAIERDLVKLERDFALATSELAGLLKAEIPLEIRDLEMQVLEAESDFESENQYLTDSHELLEEDLVSEQEIKKQQLKVKQVKSRLEKLELQLKLTKEYLHPSQVEKAQVRLASAEQEWGIAKAQLEACSVKAPSDGLVVYRPLHVGGEYRSVRVGDAIYKNQPFMYIPDMNDLVVNCYVPEAELSLVAEDRACEITSLAYPDMTLNGLVETIGFMAQNKPGLKNWQKYFSVVVALEAVDVRLRTDMSVQVRVLSYDNPDAIKIPRSAVWWEEGVAQCRVRKGHRVEIRPLKLGRANDMNYEVLSGLTVGESVVVE